MKKFHIFLYCDLSIPPFALFHYHIAKFDPFPPFFCVWFHLNWFVDALSFVSFRLNQGSKEMVQFSFLLICFNHLLWLSLRSLVQTVAYLLLSGHLILFLICFIFFDGFVFSYGLLIRLYFSLFVDLELVSSHWTRWSGHLCCESHQ